MIENREKIETPKGQEASFLLRFVLFLTIVDLLWSVKQFPYLFTDEPPSQLEAIGLVLLSVIIIVLGIALLGKASVEVRKCLKEGMIIWSIVIVIQIYVLLVLCSDSNQEREYRSNLLQEHFEKQNDQKPLKLNRTDV